ncbi:putative ankyrin repeat protein [Podospora aff. communis PSN243]|uniref:Ankyrin repeat protein n=1 Tax=Podospora aff. communis PSN243 TaxID=3040156 RepID=A0AAV9GU95_9PEZI|nr:putative ankyrin repeat protein [Podospora aff. communis PSN243]
MSEFAIVLAEEGDASSSLRSRNLDGEDFREVLVVQGNHGPDFITRAEIVALASGTMTKDGPPATAIVFRFSFLSFKKNPKRRFVSTKISVEFGDVLSRSNLDPEVIAIFPDGNVALDRVTLSKDVEMGLHATVAPFNWLDAGFDWKVSQTKTNEFSARQMGIKFNSRRTFTGADNMAIWQLVEHGAKRQGIPSFFQTAVLLQRRGSDKVTMKISIESELDTVSTAGSIKKRLFGGLVTEPVDPINISPKMFKIRDLEGADELQEDSASLGSMKTLRMGKFTGVERALAVGGHMPSGKQNAEAQKKEEDNAAGAGKDQ